MRQSRRSEADFPRRGEVWWVDFSPSAGKKIRDEHPALVISSDHLNRSPFGMLVVVPISSSSPPLRIHVDVPAGDGGLRKSSRIKCDQIGKADNSRFRRNGKIGDISSETMRKVETILRRVLVL